MVSSARDAIATRRRSSVAERRDSRGIATDLVEVAAFVPPVATARGVEEGADAAVGFAADVERVLRGDGLAAHEGGFARLLRRLDGAGHVRCLRSERLLRWWRWWGVRGGRWGTL